MPPAPKICSAAASSMGCRLPTTFLRFVFICSKSWLTGATIWPSSALDDDAADAGLLPLVLALAGEGGAGGMVRTGASALAGVRTMVATEGRCPAARCWW